MKKFFAVVLALCMMLVAVSAMAETRTYMQTSVVDAEGNVVTLEEAEEASIIYFTLDDEAFTCTFGVNEDAYDGTYVITEETENEVVLHVTLSDGTELDMVYSAADDAFGYDAGEYTCVLHNVETLLDNFVDALTEEVAQ